MVTNIAPHLSATFVSGQKHPTNDRSPLLDRQVLAGFSPQGPRDVVMNHMNQLIIRHGRESLAQLQSALERNDLEAISQTAHRWRGSCLSLGLLRLGNTLTKLDTASAQDATEYLLQTKELIPTLESIFADSCAELTHSH